MEKKIEELYKDINFLGYSATYLRNNTYVDNCKELFPAIQEFVQWFFENVTGLEKEIYLNLTDILKDCETAFREHDAVLMMDALEQGIAGYLEMFLTDAFLKEKETAYVGRAKET